jgi:DNA-binding NtrC family response regulator
MRSRAKILVVDDEPSITGAMEVILADRGYDLKTAGTARQCRDALDKNCFDVVFTDLRLPDADGIELITQIRNESPDTEVILMTAHGSLDVTIDAIKKGAYYYIEKPFRPDEVVTLAERAVKRVAIGRENRTLRRAMDNHAQKFGMIGRSAKMVQIYETIAATANSDASVLIEGESGTGKELIASALHTHSTRAGRQFIHINCAAIPSELIESELFGYRRGAFTGADRDKRGLIEAASGGTILLDEVTEMPMHLQAKLLRLLQERKLRRLGEEQERAVDFRLISATNRETGVAIRDGLLREDLYFRIGTIKIRVPPLRERLDDLPLLAQHFLNRYASRYRKQIGSISKPALDRLSRYGWPGNIRELESVIESSVLFCRQEQIEPSNLPQDMQASQSKQARCEFPPFLTLDEIECEALQRTLERTGGNIKKAAQILRVHRPTFYRMMRKFGIKGSDSPPGSRSEH